jgi:acyl-CoA synthetase (NDP forming)
LSSGSELDVSGRALQLRAVDLDRFLHPRTVAVIGASDTPGRPNAGMTKKVKDWADAHGAEFFPVHPTHGSVLGVPCVRSVFDVPGDLDLAVIVTSKAIESLEEVVERKAAFAVIFAAGFAETGAAGRRQQARLEALVRGSDVHLLGPNTNLNAFEEFRTDLGGRSIALVTQSGHQGRPVFQGQELGIRLSHWAPTGNEVDLEFADFVRYFADQPEVGVVAAYVEGFKDGRSLQLALDEAARRRTPVVVVKVGRSDEGRAMALAHTGHLTGSDAVISSVFRQYGVTRAEGLDDLLETAAMFARTQVATRPDPGVCVYSISGGTGAHMADLLAAAGVRLPPLARSTQRALHDGLIPGYLRVSNPVDCGGGPVADARGRTILDLLVADPAVDALVVPITGSLGSYDEPFVRDLVAVAATTPKPVFVVWGSPPGTDDTWYRALLDGGLPVFRTFGNCVRAVRAYAAYAAFAHRYSSPFADVPREPRPAARTVRRILGAAEPGGALSEHSSKEVLRAYGIRVSKDVLCGSAAAAVKAAGAFGYPVVMKVSSPDLLHKSDAGLVRLGVASAREVRTAYDELLRKARRADRKARVEGVLVCETVTGGVETVVGVSRDELFGPVVMVGLGGVLVEVLGDVSFRVPPFDEAEAERMVRELAGAALLDGVRGDEPVDVGALVDVIMKVQRLALDCAGEIAELDVNPLVVRPRGAVALDALVVRKKESRSV